MPFVKFHKQITIGWIDWKIILDKTSKKNGSNF